MVGDSAAPGGQGVPAPLYLISRFVNTCDLDTGDESLGRPQDLAEWAAAAELVPPGARFTRADLDRVRAVREGLRALLSANNGEQHPEDRAAVAELDRIAADVNLRARFSGGGPGGWESASRRPADRVIGRLLANVMTAAADGSWPRLKACREHGCRWAFYDRSKNRSGTWCSMSVCGNAAKQRAYVARRSAARSPRR